MTVCVCVCVCVPVHWLATCGGGEVMRPACKQIHCMMISIRLLDKDHRSLKLQPT